LVSKKGLAPWANQQFKQQVPAKQNNTKNVALSIDSEPGHKK